MKFTYPFKSWVLTQPFAKNYNTYYVESGYKGHTGQDYKALGDPTILAVAPGYVYSLMNKDNPDLMRFRAVFTLVEDEVSGLAYEVSYGHCSDIYAKIGDVVKQGDKIALQGNTGDVSVNGEKVTQAQKIASPQIGAHLHLQVRLVKPVEEKPKLGMPALSTSSGLFKKDGFYFEIVNYQNGFSGCIDPAQFFEGHKPVLKYGSRGQAVKELQKKLSILEDGIFGKQTNKAVIAFQLANDLVADGIVGKLTWIALN